MTVMIEDLYITWCSSTSRLRSHMGLVMTRCEADRTMYPVEQSTRCNREGNQVCQHQGGRGLGVSDMAKVSELSCKARQH